MKKAHSHVHERSYFGQMDAMPLVRWLNDKARPSGDAVERLIQLNARLPIEATEQEIRSYLGGLVRRSKLAVAPVLVSAAPDRWSVDWRLVGRLPPLQGLAVIKVLHLADRGLLSRVRACGATNCQKWFYARFEHMRFHCAQCQQETFRSDPAWKKQRAEYMKQLRHETKMRERKWSRSLKRKGRR